MWRRTLPILLATMLFAAGLVVGTTSPVAAADGLSYRSTTTYTLDAAAGVVHVLADITLTNTVPDQRDGNIINRRYFTGFSLPVPVGVTNQVATTANGRTLTLVPRLVDGNTRFLLFDVDFASNLFYNQTAHVIVSYDITGLPPRSEIQSRVNSAYASFTVFGIGDAGKVTVRIVVPADFEVETFGGDYAVTEEFGNTVYTATDVPNPDEFEIFVSARNDKGLVDTPIETDAGDDFLLRTWPGDTEWQAFVTDEIEEGVPALSELIGQPWPIDESLEIRQAYTPYLYGYAGWFSAADNEIEIGEDLDQETVLHELSHAWFNDEWFTDRWLSEGYAQAYSNEAVELSGGDRVDPDDISMTDPGRVPLLDWGSPNFTDGADDVEAFGYNASYWIVQELIDEIGDDAMREVLAKVADRTIVYVGEGPAEEANRPTDWRRFLDLMEETGGSTQAFELIDQYVVSNPNDGQYVERKETREAYFELVDAGGDWAPPLVIRRRMSDWVFLPARQLIDEANGVLDLRDELDGKAAELGVGYPGEWETKYQDVRGDFDEVRDGVQDLIDTADHVLAAVAADAADDDVFAKVGLLGTNLPSLLDEARAAFEAGDHDLARARAQEVIDTVDEAPSVGKERSLWAGGGVALFLLLVILSILLVRRRRRRRRHAAVAVAEADAAPQAAAQSVPLGDADALDLDEDALSGAGDGSVDH